MPKQILDEHYIFEKPPYFDLRKRKLAKAVLISAILWNIIWFVLRVFFMGESYDVWFFTIGDVSAVPKFYFGAGIMLSAFYLSVSMIVLLHIVEVLRPGFEEFINKDWIVWEKILSIITFIIPALFLLYAALFLLYSFLFLTNEGGNTQSVMDLHCFLAHSLGFLLQYLLLTLFLSKTQIPKDETTINFSDVE